MNSAAGRFFIQVICLVLLSAQASAGGGGKGNVSDLSITKTDGLNEAVSGQQITYTIEVSNAGPDDAVGAIVNDVVPAEINNATWTCTAQAGSSCTANGVGDIADTADILAGSYVTYYLTGTINFGYVGWISNTATVASGSGSSDPDPTYNSATDRTYAIIGVVPVPTLSAVGLAILMVAVLCMVAFRRRSASR